MFNQRFTQISEDLWSCAWVRVSLLCSVTASCTTCVRCFHTKDLIYWESLRHLVPWTTRTTKARPTVMYIEAAWLPSVRFVYKVAQEKQIRFTRKKDSKKFMLTSLYTSPTIPWKNSRLTATTMIAKRLRKVGWSHSESQKNKTGRGQHAQVAAVQSSSGVCPCRDQCRHQRRLQPPNQIQYLILWSLLETLSKCHYQIEREQRGLLWWLLLTETRECVSLSSTVHCHRKARHTLQRNWLDFHFGRYSAQWKKRQ